MESKLPDSYNSSHPTAAIIGAEYWDIEHHPNIGISFSGITLSDFFINPIKNYKSKGYETSPGVYLSQDTYLDL